jgi:hypothetical protein
LFLQQPLLFGPFWTQVAPKNSTRIRRSFSQPLSDSLNDSPKSLPFQTFRFKGALDYLWLVMGMHDSYKQHEHLRFLFFHPNLNPQGDFLLWSLSSR